MLLRHMARPIWSRGALLSLALLLQGAGAAAEPQGPAYLVEPSAAPPGSVPVDDASAPEAGETTPPADDSTSAGDTTGDTDVAPPSGGEPETAPIAPDDDPRALDEFRAKLDPYGSWFDDPSYGTVWIPDQGVVGMDFAPYLTSGRWVVDTDGNRSWQSDYPFGDVVFHYGRWVWSSRGWAWIPGYAYAPAWVAWRVPTDAYAYYGWAPMPPDFVWVNHSPAWLSWRSSYYWLFCPTAFLTSATPSLYVVRSAADARSLAHHTRAYVPAVPRRTMTGVTVSTPLPRPARPGSPLPRAAGRVRYVPAPRAAAAPQTVPPPGRPRPAPGTATPAVPPGAIAPRVAPGTASPRVPPGVVAPRVYQRPGAAPRRGR